MTDVQSMWAYCALQPNDKIAMLALADAREEMGDDRTAEVLRWAARRGYRPRRTIADQWTWDRASVGDRKGPPNELPWFIYTAIFGVGTISQTRVYHETYQDAFDSVRQAFAVLDAERA